MTVTLPHNFSARPYQEDFFSAMNKGCKRAVLIWHRRAGKDLCVWNYLIYTAYETKGIYYYIFPTFAQGRKVLWDGMTSDGQRFLDFIPKGLVANLNQQEMKIRLINGSLIQVVGSDRYDALMGTNPTGCIFSEYSLQDPNAWQYIRPILDVNDGWAIFIFTPRGSNHAKELYDMAQNNPGWFKQLLTVDDTKILGKKDIEEIRKENMSEDMIQQEFYCSFTLGIQGSYYAKYLEEARKESRIGRVPWDRSQRVHVAVDIGFGDSTSVIFFQLASKEIHIIDSYEASGADMSHYAKLFKDKPYLYGSFFAPQDMVAHEYSSGHSRKEVFANMGIDFIILPTNKWTVDDGIELVRQCFNRFWIDDKNCNHVVQALENYRKEYDEKNKCYKLKPKHDQWSHCADAVRYMCMGIKCFVDTPKGPDDDQVDEWMDRYKPRF